MTRRERREASRRGKRFGTSSAATAPKPGNTDEAADEGSRERFDAWLASIVPQDTDGVQETSRTSVKLVTMSKPIEASIVVVDDEPSIRELLVASLHFAGFDVATAASGSEAIEVIEKTQPDLIVLDIMLPDIDGFTVTRRIRQEGIGAPVLFLTARDDTQDKVMGLTVGGDDYVTKPFSLEEVVARIRAILRRTRRAGGGRPDHPRRRPWRSTRTPTT